jgi:hypothetical protein
LTATIVISLRNVGGSFDDFRAEPWRDTIAASIVEPPDARGGCAIGAWAQRLAGNRGYDPAAEELELAAEAIDSIYAEAKR